MTDRVLTRRELNRALLARQLLLRREPATPIEVMERLVGMQAQEPPDPYVALWSRIEDFGPLVLSADLEARRAVRAVGLLRGTIHLVSARDCAQIRPLVEMTGPAWFNEVFFDNVRIPRANILGEVNKGWDITMTMLGGYG